MLVEDEADDQQHKVEDGDEQLQDDTEFGIRSDQLSEPKSTCTTTTSVSAVRVQNSQ